MPTRRSELCHERDELHHLRSWGWAFVVTHGVLTSPPFGFVRKRGTEETVFTFPVTSPLLALASVHGQGLGRFLFQDKISGRHRHLLLS